MTTETQAPPAESRLGAIEAMLPHLATEEDIAKLETKISESRSEILRWLVGAIAVSTTILGLLIALTD